MMLKRIIIIIVVVFNHILVAQNVIDTYYTIAFSANTFSDVDKGESRAIVNVLGKKLVGEYDKTGVGGSKLINVESELKSSLDSGVDMFVMLSSEFIDHKHLNALIPRYSILVDGEVGFQYHIVTNLQSGITGISDLQSKSISLLGDNEYSPTFQWLAALLKEDNLEKPNDFFF